MPSRSNGFLFPRPHLIRNLFPHLPLIHILLALLGAWFGFANPILHVPVLVLLLPGSLVLVARQATSMRQAIRLGFITSWPAYAAALYWVAIPVHDYGGLPWALALPCPVLVGALLALYASLFCLFLYVAKKTHPALGTLFAAVLWAGLELARNTILTGFPWLSLSSALAPWPWALGLAAWIGAFGLSGVLVGACYALLMGRGPWKFIGVILLAVCIVPAQLQKPENTPDTASVALIQGNIDQDQKWEKKLQTSILESYLDLSRKAARTHRPDLIIWPETALPFYFQDKNDLSSLLSDAVAALKIPFLIGSPAYSATFKSQGPDYILHNRAYLLDAYGQTVAWYDKEHLVPFGEYVPLGQWLPFIAKLVPGEYEFGPGQNMPPLQSNKLALGTLICYEAIFPELAQKQVAQGANVLVNISNDAWFGRSSAPSQHLHLAILRAVEQNRSLIRATNTGITAIIASTGQILQQTKTFSPEYLYQDQVELLTDTTFYHQNFKFIHLSFLALTAGLLPLVLGSRKQLI